MLFTRTPGKASLYDFIEATLFDFFKATNKTP